MAISNRVRTIRTAGLFGAALAGLMIAGGGPCAAASKGCNSVNEGNWNMVVGSGQSFTGSGQFYGEDEVVASLYALDAPAQNSGSISFGGSLLGSSSATFSQYASSEGAFIGRYSAAADFSGLLGGLGTGTFLLSVAGGIVESHVTCSGEYWPEVNFLNPYSGPSSGGTYLAIYGHDFTGATAVMFGANNATLFEVADESFIEAIAPAGSGTVDVTVTTPDGTSLRTAHDQFTYGTPPPAPTVAAVAPQSGAGGTVVTITGTNFGGETAVNFGGNSMTSFNLNSVTSITAIVPPTSGTMDVGTLDVTVTTAGGTSATSAADKFDTVSSFTAAPDQGRLAVTFEAGGLTLPTTYTVNFGDGTSGALTQSSCIIIPPVGGGGGIRCFGSASHSYASAGIYTAALLNASGNPVGSVNVNPGGISPLAAIPKQPPALPPAPTPAARE